jgi:hypothetical protein
MVTENACKHRRRLHSGTSAALAARVRGAPGGHEAWIHDSWAIWPATEHVCPPNVLLRNWPAGRFATCRCLGIYLTYCQQLSKGAFNRF